MKRICENLTSIQEIKKSKFITKLYYVKTIEEVKKYLEDIKKEYKDATHYCYAYIIDNLKKSSDDGEPGGTAGVPMMEILNKHNMNYILCIIVRYFGGIKLGAGGLVRAYSSSVRKSLEEAQIKELVEALHIRIKTEYQNENKLIQLLGKENIIKKEYKESLIIEGNIKKEEIDHFSSLKIEIIEKTFL